MILPVPKRNVEHLPRARTNRLLAVLGPPTVLRWPLCNIVLRVFSLGQRRRAFAVFSLIATLFRFIERGSTLGDFFLVSLSHSDQFLRVWHDGSLRL